MKLMDLGHKKTDGAGREIPGAISVYLVRLPSGDYVQEYKGALESKFVPEWHRAQFYFGFSGMLEAQAIAVLMEADVYIVNCSVPTKCSS